MGTELIRERTHSQVEGRQVQHKQDVFTLVHLSCAAQTPASHSVKEESVHLSITAKKSTNLRPLLDDLTVLLPLSILAVRINTISGTNMSQMLMQIKAEPFPE